jgi:DNA mismatch repair ATPase MutL
LNVNNKNKVTLKTPKEANEPFAIVHAENAFELCKENLVPIYEEYDKRNVPGEEKAFQMLPRKFATDLLKIEGNAMFPEDNFTEAEKEALDAFVEKRYVKSAKVAGKTVYFELDSRIRKYLVNVLKQRD